MSASRPGFLQVFFDSLGSDLPSLLHDDETVRRLGALAEPALHPRVEVVFFSAGGQATIGPLHGFDGFVAGWREWLSPFASYRVETEGVSRQGDRLVALVRQHGTTVHGGVEVPSPPSAAVFTVREGVIVRAAFYMDRGDAARLEGVDVA